MAVLGLNNFYASGMGMPARGEAAFSIAIRFASASIIRCRSAYLVEVRSNLRLPRHYSMRRAPVMPPWQAKANLLKSVIDGDCVRLPNRRQSDSEDRSKPSRIAMPLGRLPIPQAVHLFKPQSRNVKTFLLGDLKGAVLFCEREQPPLPRSLLARRDNFTLY